jgi:hypothetical protein
MGYFRGVKKKKVKLPVCLIKQTPSHEDVWDSSGIAALFLISALDGGEWSASCPCCFTPRVRATDTHWIGGWVGPIASLDATEIRKS